MAATTSLSPDQRQRVMAALRRWWSQPGANQRAMGKAIGVSQQTISAILIGEQPGALFAMRFAKVLGTSFEMLIDGIPARYGEVEGWGDVAKSAQVAPLLLERVAQLPISILPRPLTARFVEDLAALVETHAPA